MRVKVVLENKTGEYTLGIYTAGVVIDDSDGDTVLQDVATSEILAVKSPKSSRWVTSMIGDQRSWDRVFIQGVS